MRLNNQTLKERNRGLILSMIARNEAISRVELSRRSNLTKMSITNIVAELIEKNIVEESEVNINSGIGRNAVNLRISPNAPKCIGILLHRDYCCVTLTDLKYQVFFCETEEINEENHGRILENICGMIDKILNKTEQIFGIGIGALGPVDITKGVILNPPNFYGIQNIPIVSFLQEKYGLPVYMDNMCNCAALSEKYFGVGKKYEDFLYIGISNGIGSGIIVNNKVSRNVNGLSSELGHMSIDYKGHICACGNRGCLETYAGIRVIEKMVREKKKKNYTFQEICAEYEDPEINKILMEMTEKLSYGIVNAVNFINPQAVIIGLDGKEIPLSYIKILEERINRFRVFGKEKYISVKASRFSGNKSMAYPVCALLEKVFEGKEIER